jgi:hypothetical protein
MTSNALTPKELDDQQTAAKEALDRADAHELFVLYQRLVQERAELSQVIETLAKHYVGGKDEPRSAAPESDSVVAAMQTVALAAIDLAKTICTEKRNP